MGDLLDTLTGGGARRAQKQQMEVQQRTSLAALANQQAEVDQASSDGSTGRRRGRGLLTFVPSLGGNGQSTLG